MKIFQYSWTEMSGGFDCEVNIKASTKKKANEIFLEKVGEKQWRNPKDIFLKGFVHVSDLNKIYTSKHIEKMNLEIHFEEVGS